MRSRKVICVILSIILIIGTTSVNVNAQSLSREGKISAIDETIGMIEVNIETEKLISEEAAKGFTLVGCNT